MRNGLVVLQEREVWFRVFSFRHPQGFEIAIESECHSPDNSTPKWPGCQDVENTTCRSLPWPTARWLSCAHCPSCVWGSLLCERQFSAEVTSVWLTRLFWHFCWPA